ncbi:hypothetical protein A1O1_06202 [Capronia coronata CBS 617.96]|uniref:Uncharacterized protein n=1 Tax=Capronia coronata CBS 617.96 TaxID=1182541 RepID=W9Y058_9EURO|nr:uncharacterized protein A1O1_06202 [Capronia coronata CBS 617.96]EXJ85833.1 hypothetical protein A1O1_06202 [Capronia coronata CBS 617.96]
MLESQRAWFVSEALVRRPSGCIVMLNLIWLCTQIVQDVGSEDRCFLAHPRWQALFEASARPSAVEWPSGFSLRAQLCDFLVQIPELITEVSNIVESLNTNAVVSVGLADRHQSALLRTSSIKKSVEGWYSTDLEPRRSLVTLQPDDEQPNSDHLAAYLASATQTEFPQPDLLIMIVHCVSNHLMVRLDTLLSSLISSSPYDIDRTGLCPCLATMLTRRDAAFQYWNVVKSISQVAAKPLEYGIRQLWANDTAGLDPFA